MKKHTTKKIVTFLGTIFCMNVAQLYASAREGVIAAPEISSIENPGDAALPPQDPSLLPPPPPDVPRVELAQPSVMMKVYCADGHEAELSGNGEFFSECVSAGESENALASAKCCQCVTARAICDMQHSGLKEGSDPKYCNEYHHGEGGRCSGE